MLKRISLFGSTLAILLLASADSGAQKKGKDKETKKDPAATANDYKMILNMRLLFGKISAVDKSGSLTLEVDYPHIEPNPNYKSTPGGNTAIVQQLQSLYQQQQQASTISNVAKRQAQVAKVQQQIQQVQAKIAQQAQKDANPFGPNGPFKLIQDTKDFTLEFGDKAEVRKWSLEGSYDEDGNFKTYTKAEMAELRGKDPSKPGYKGKVDDLRAGQLVNLYLAPPRKDEQKSTKDEKPIEDKPKADKAKDEKPAKDGKPSESGLANIPRPTVTMILILQDSASGMSGGPGDKKKKKN